MLDLLTEAEELVRRGDHWSAVEKYREYIQSQAVSAAQYYEIGVSLLAHCERNFVEEFYQLGIECLFEAYNLQAVEKKEIYTLLFTVVYSPNADMLASNYQRNTQNLHMPDYEELPFLLFPLATGKYRVYDKVLDVFLSTDIETMDYSLYISFMVDDDVLRTEEFAHLLERMMREQSAERLLRGIEADLCANKLSAKLLAQIEQFHDLCPYSSKYEWAMHIYFYLRGDYHEAIKQIEQGLGRYPLDGKLRYCAAETYFQMGLYDKAAANYVLVAIENKVKECFDEEEYSIADDFRKGIERCFQLAPNQWEVVKEINRVVVYAREFIWQKEFFYDEHNGLSTKKVFLFGKIVERLEDDLAYFGGIYAEYSRVGTKAGQLDTLLACGNMVGAYRTTFDLLAADIKNRVLCKPDQYPCLIPFMATEHEQKIKFVYQDKSYQKVFGKAECNFLNIAAPLKMSSNQNFAIGKPIVLKHDPARKKLVLSILVDALSFAKLKERDFALMPKVKRFFDQGLIFTENYTPAEWTLPSTAAIQTGLYQDRTKIFHPDTFVQMPLEYQTAAQQMSKQGYYCMLFAGLLSQRLCNAYRGFHRAIVDESFGIDVLVAAALKHMRALDGTDLYMHFHLMDVHIHNKPISLEQKTNLPLEDYFDLSLSDQKSVFSKETAANLHHYEAKIKLVDDVLGNLFSELESMYKEDEYAVVLYADHGIALVGQEDFMFKEGMANAPLMVRGNNIPQIGLYNNEMTNTIDVYPILAHLCGFDTQIDLDAVLPKVLGGQGRDYSISNSLYPERNYIMSIRTLKYEFRLETIGKVDISGKVNMNRFRCELFERYQYDRRIKDRQLILRFLHIAFAHTKRIHDPRL